MRSRKCKYCQRDGLWVQTGWHDGPVWRLFDLDPVPFDTCRVRPAIVLSRTRGILFADTSFPTPDVVYPAHRCPQYLDAVEEEQLHRMLPHDEVAAFLAGEPLTPTTPTPARRRRAS
jgi:hypothetical protein